MIDLGLSKIALIGVVALVVIGPEKLPKVARMAGTLFGRAQRYINEVKSEVSREIELDELRKMQKEVQEAASGVEQSIAQNLAEIEQRLNAAWTMTDRRASIRRTPDPKRRGQGKRLPQEKACAHFGDSVLVQEAERPQDPRDFGRCPRRQYRPASAAR